MFEKLNHCIGFQWDAGNLDKNWGLHRVSNAESEQVFFNQPLIVADDPVHSLGEDRYFALGQTERKRPLFVVFTIRQDLIRVISAREMTKKERSVYRAS